MVRYSDPQSAYPTRLSIWTLHLFIVIFYEMRDTLKSSLHSRNQRTLNLSQGAREKGGFIPTLLYSFSLLVSKDLHKLALAKPTWPKRNSLMYWFTSAGFSHNAQ